MANFAVYWHEGVFYALKMYTNSKGEPDWDGTNRAIAKKKGMYKGSLTNQWRLVVADSYYGAIGTLSEDDKKNLTDFNWKENPKVAKQLNAGIERTLARCDEAVFELRGVFKLPRPVPVLACGG